MTSTDPTAYLVREVRREFTNMTGLFTYAARPWTTGGTFDAECPVTATQEADLDQFISEAESTGVVVTIARRNRRMTITLTTAEPEPEEQFMTTHATPVALDREETEPCQRGTVGCSVDHPQTGREFDCEGW